VFEHYTFDGGLRSVAGTTMVQPDVWYHVVGIAENGGLAKLFVNGQQEGGTAPIGGLWTGGDQWRIASPSGHGMNWFAGAIDEVAIYDHALAPDQIRAHYFAGLPEPGTLALLGLGLAALRRRRKA
jgi:hypothetical protein